MFMRSRVLVPALFLVSVLVAPLALSAHEKHKDSNNSQPAKQSPPPQSHAPAHHQDSGQHSSNGGSNNGGESHHEAEHHHGSNETNGSGGGSNQTNGTGGSNHTYGTHDTSSQQQQQQQSHGSYGSHDPRSQHEARGTHTETPSDHAHHGTHEWSQADHNHAVIDHHHLHERMQTHPDSGARLHAYQHSRNERAQFHRYSPPVHFVPAHRVVLTNIRIVPSTYHYRRTVFYDEYGWEPPAYVFSMYPRYGLWDATFLAFALDHIAEEQYALMFYHHQQEPEMQQWLEDTNRAAANDEVVREKLDALQTKMASLQESAVVADPTYVPPDVQDVALSPEVIEKLTAN